MAEGKELISVIMPCFNGEAFLEEAVRSALGQSHPEVELLVVDDGSSDRSPALLEALGREFPGRLRVFSQKNSGPFPARNLGLSQARGEYIAFLDADDYWAPDCLARLHRALEGAGADLAYCGWQNVGNLSSGNEPYLPPRYESEDPVQSFLRACPWPIHAALVRRSVIEALHGFSVRRFSAMDYDLWIRLLAVTAKLVRVPEVLAFYRWHDAGQISAVRWRQVLDAWAVRRDFVRENPGLVAHIGKQELRQLVDGFLYRSGYAAYWKRDVASAQLLFRKLLPTGYWKCRDLRHLLPALLPEKLYRRFMSWVALQDGAGGSR